MLLVPGMGLDHRSSARLRKLVGAEVVPLPGAGRRAPVPGLDELAGRLRGARDRLCLRDWATALAGAAPRGRLVEIERAAYMTVQTHPAAWPG